MTTLLAPPVTDAGFARWLADQVGTELLRLRAELGFADPVLLRKTGDEKAHDLIVTLLTRWRPGDAVLSEEGAHDDLRRLRAPRVWIVDPLDGTREYGEPDRTDWAVHIALWQGGALVAGAVAMPARGLTLSTDQPPSYPDMRDVGVGRPLRVATSRTRPPALLDRFVREWGEVEPVPMGSAGVKVCAVVSGVVDAYLHAGGQYEWDSAAPVAVATATGLYASRIDGSALEYNRPDPSLPDLLVCRKDLAPRILAALDVARAHPPT
ncbi:3'(2'),5'-bisphosphate nucleotidase CysQ [Luedemannella flava]|uniref:3'(2'),5'-bisphosphate nucleotidase CysQ n=1 Tax=Luedemannella flava TaxID=349316 RepID=A0ABP4YN79_9ACTN